MYDNMGAYVYMCVYVGAHVCVSVLYAPMLSKMVCNLFLVHTHDTDGAAYLCAPGTRTAPPRQYQAPPTRTAAARTSLTLIHSWAVADHHQVQ
jgi:hypothetical protein